MGSISARSAIAKYNCDPRLATIRYFSRAWSISLDVTFASSIRWLIILEVTLLASNVLINSSLSRILPCTSLINRRILSSKSCNCLLSCEICIIKLILVSSNSIRSYFITSISSWSSNPEGVTVKFIKVTLMLISGR